MGSDGYGRTKWGEWWIPLELVRAVTSTEELEKRLYEKDGKRYWNRELVYQSDLRNEVQVYRRIATRKLQRDSYEP